MLSRGEPGLHPCPGRRRSCHGPRGCAPSSSVALRVLPNGVVRPSGQQDLNLRQPIDVADRRSDEFRSSRRDPVLFEPIGSDKTLALIAWLSGEADESRCQPNREVSPKVALPSIRIVSIGRHCGGRSPSRRAVSPLCASGSAPETSLRRSTASIIGR